MQSFCRRISSSAAVSNVSAAVLCRSTTSLERALQALTETAGFHFVAPPAAYVVGDHEVIVATLHSGTVAVELMYNPSLRWRWRDTPHFRQQVHLMGLAVSRGMHHPEPAPASWQVVEQHLSVITLAESMAHKMYGGMPLQHGRIVERQAPTVSATSPTVSHGDRLKEVVIGVEASWMEASASLLDGAYARHDTVIGVWKPEKGPFIRLLPSKHSALVLSATDATLSDAANRIGSTSADVSVSVYGERRGDARCGQLLISTPALEGLDLRMCVQPDATAYFNERPGAVYDDADPDLNPDPSNALARSSLSCTGVVGKLLVSRVKQRLGIPLR
jgi:hypothetical protein